MIRTERRLWGKLAQLVPDGVNCVESVVIFLLSHANIYKYLRRIWTGWEKVIEACELCAPAAGRIAWEDAFCYVVPVSGEEGVAFPGFCRVVWRAHVREMTDLSTADRSHLMCRVFAVEGAVRRLANPDKINLASLGNVVPHLHWHVIPRWHDDSHFPAPIWANNRRTVAARSNRFSYDALRAAIDTALAEQRDRS
jgi:diadenosine tetraphosphate (Ap4A) HIT family hydrolase